MCNICFCAFLQVYTNTHSHIFVHIKEHFFGRFQGILKQTNWICFMYTHIILYIWWWIKKLMHRRMILYICVFVVLFLIYFEDMDLYILNITLRVLFRFIWQIYIFACGAVFYFDEWHASLSFWMNCILDCVVYVYIFSCRSFWYDDTNDFWWISRIWNWKTYLYKYIVLFVICARLFLWGTIEIEINYLTNCKIFINIICIDIRILFSTL